MEAGRELDAAVGLLIGWRRGDPRRGQHEWFSPEGQEGAPLPPFSTDVRAAWLVVEAVNAKGWAFQIDNCGIPSGYRVQIGWGDDPVSEHAEAATAPHAICLASLRAINRSMEVNHG